MTRNSDRGNQSELRANRQSGSSTQQKGKAADASSMEDRGSGRPDERSHNSGRGTSNASMQNTEAGNTGFGSGQISPQTHDRANRSGGATAQRGRNASNSSSRLNRSGEDSR